MSKSKHFVFLLVEEFSHIAFACAVEPLRIANLLSGEELYKWSFASEDGLTVTSSNGAVMNVHHSFADLPDCDRLFVLSGINMKNHITPSLLAVLRYQKYIGIRIGALCSGAYILAAAGFLEGMKTTIHWEFQDSFMEEFPTVNLVRNVFVADEKHITASGGTATADLMLHLIESDHGYDLSLSIADQMVYTSAREATAEQRVSLQSRNGMRNTHLARAVQKMHDTISAPVPPSLIAQEIGISVRQLERLFGRHLNSSPRKYYIEMRLERARLLLIQTDRCITDIAFACGFSSSNHFSRAYRATFGLAPSVQRGKIT